MPERYFRDELTSGGRPAQPGPTGATAGETPPDGLPPPAAKSSLLKLAEVADRLRVSRRTVERLIADGRLRVLHPSPGRVVVESREVDAYLAARRRVA